MEEVKGSKKGQYQTMQRKEKKVKKKRKHNEM